MLPFHEQMVAELLEQDGLTVLAAGLGLPKLLCAFVRLHASSAPGSVLLILSANDEQRKVYWSIIH